MPTTSEMRYDLYRVYDFKPGWRYKVNQMPYSQLQAVWLRFAENDFDPEKIKKDGVFSVTTQKKLLKSRESMPVAEIKQTTYLCQDCRGWFVADNPELEECRLCGSKLIMKGRYIKDDVS